MATKIHGSLGTPRTLSILYTNTSASGGGTLYTVPTGRKATVTMRMSLGMTTGNSSAGTVTPAVTLGSGTIYTQTFFISADGSDSVSFADTGILMGAGETLSCGMTSSNNAVATAHFMVYGIEEDI